jgi:hypothetical protein
MLARNKGGGGKLQKLRVRDGECDSLLPPPFGGKSLSRLYT